MRVSRPFRSWIARIAVASSVAAILITVPAAVSAPEPALAADASDWNPGNIIDDAVFYNSAAMDAGSVQSFLEQRVRNCAAGYTCLKDYRQNTDSRPADRYCEGYTGRANERAAQIIDNVARSCGISQQVLLVLLEKEQSLVTDSSPQKQQYSAATGQGCPDTAPCDPATLGFFYQVYYAARQYEVYRLNPTWWGYRAGRWNNILYHHVAERNCGSSQVYIENQATAGLYIYTPYQPNAAALRNLYGTGDNCSSYGNRNFWRLFTDWFGSTHGGCPAPTVDEITAAPRLMVTTAPAVNVRGGPSLGCTGGARQVGEGVLLPRKGTHGDWSLVTVDGVDGWIHSDYLIPLDQTPAAVLRVDEPRHVLALDSSGGIWAYPFSPSGRWGEPVRMLAGQAMSQLVPAGDLTGDGRRDLVALDRSKRVWLYRGNGEGYLDPVRLGVDWSTATRVTGAGDVDGDGIPDVFTVASDSSLQLWRGNGRGGFRAPERVGNGWGGMNLLVGGLDLNADGKTDVLARTASGQIYAYHGDGQGGWSGSALIGSGWAGMTAIFAPGDFTGDGRPDVLARTASGALLLYNGTSNGLAFVAQVGAGWAAMTSLAGAGIAVPPASDRNLPPGAGDMTGDGEPDVLAVAGSTLLLYHGDGRGGWAGSSTLSTNWPTRARLVTMGDFNRDGLRDVGRVDADGTFWLLPGAATGGLEAPIQIGNGWGAFTALVGGMDFDGDGATDVIARDGVGNLLLYRGNSTGGWHEGATVIGNGWHGFDVIFNAGDFDGDGASDLLVRTRAGTLHLYPTTGAGAWRDPRQIGVGWSGFTSLTGPGDFDGDGRTDVLARTPSGALYIYRGNGSGGWSVSGQIGQGWNSISQIA